MPVSLTRTCTRLAYPAVWSSEDPTELKKLCRFPSVPDRVTTGLVMAATDAGDETG